MGGGSDLPSYYRENGGAVLSTSINKYIYLTVNKKFDNDIRLSYSTTENVSSAQEIKHPIVRNVLNMLNINGGIEITSISDISSKGSGLGSSSSFSVGLLHALYAYQGKLISKNELGKLSSYVEIELCGDRIGKQDQYAAAYGGLNVIEFNKDDSVNVIPINCDPKTISDIEESIIVFYTGITRSASTILVDQSNNLKDKDKKILMSEMVSLVYEMKSLLENNEIDQFGELLHINWRLKSQMAKGISNSKIDDWYNKGIRAGASGGKLLGAGNGGFIMFFAPKEKHIDIAKALNNLKQVSFKFENNGSSLIYSDNIHT